MHSTKKYIYLYIFIMHATVPFRVRLHYGNPSPLCGKRAVLILSEEELSDPIRNSGLLLIFCIRPLLVPSPSCFLESTSELLGGAVTRLRQREAVQHCLHLSVQMVAQTIADERAPTDDRSPLWVVLRHSTAILIF